ncbi:MAG: Serine-rich adhesin, platelet-type, partial [Parcubacteria group bacterium GW2011_GWA2_47_64]
MASELIFDNKKFLPSSAASKASGYSSDYIGQLCRSGKLVCRRVGRGWFVEEESLLSYKTLDLNHSPSKARRLNSSPKGVEEGRSETRVEVVTKAVAEPIVTIPTISSTSDSEIHPLPAFGTSVQAVSASTQREVEESTVAKGTEESVHATEDASAGPAAIPFESIASRIRENFIGGGGRLFRHLFSLEFTQRAVALTISVALVFGPYFAKDTPTLRKIEKLAAEHSAEIAALVAEEIRGLGDITFADIKNARQALPSKITSLALRGQTLSEVAFRASGLAVMDIRYVAEEDANLFAGAVLRGAKDTARSTHGFLASISKSAMDRMSAFTAQLASRSENISLGAATLFLNTKDALASLNPIDSLARGVYRSVNRGVFALRDPIRRFLGIEDENGGAANTIVNLSTSTAKFVYTPPSSKAEPSYKYIYPAPATTERVIERQIGISQAEIEQKLSSLRARLAADIASLRSTTAGVQKGVESNATYINNVYNTVAGTNNLDRVEDLTLLNPKISFGTMTSTAVSLISGTFTALSGDSLTAKSINGTTGAFTGNLTVGGNTTISGDLVVSGTFSPATISASTSIAAPYFTATSTTATSTFAGGLAVQTDKFVVESGSGNVGLGTTSPQARLALSGYASSANPLLLISTSTPSATSTALIVTASGNLGLSTSSPTSRLAIEASTPTAAFLLNQTGTGNLVTLEDNGTAVFTVIDGGNVGIGTSSPFTKLSVAGDAYFDGTLTVSNITATGTATFANLALTGSTTLQHFTFVNATGTSATTTNLFSTNAVFTGATTTSFFTSVFNAISSIFSSITGGSATLGSLTATSSATLSYAGTNMLITTDAAGKLISSSTPVAAYYLATSSVASILPYASSTALTVSGTGYFGTASTTNLTVSSLTANRIPFLTTAGVFTDDGDLTFTSGNLLTATYASSTSLTTTGYAAFATGGGNVGIGTTSPAKTLSVQGDAIISGTLSVGNLIATSTTITLSGLGADMLTALNSSGNLVATSTPTAAAYTATSTTATS